MHHPHQRAPIRERSQASDSVRSLQVYGDVVALLELVPIERPEVNFDAPSFIVGAMAALVALQRPDARLPSKVMEFYEDTAP